MELRTLGGLARSLVIYRARPWQIARLSRFYAGFIAPGDLAIDVGAHVGNRSRALLGAGARVVALEPQAAFHRFLSHDLPSGVTLLPLAAGPEAGEVRLAVSRLHPTVSSVAPGFAERMAVASGFGHVRWDGHEVVRMTTLDVLIAQYGRPKFIKIDVEGFEADVLRGLGQAVPWIAFEYLSDDPAGIRACVERVEALGDYRFNFVVGERAAFAREWMRGREVAGVLAGDGAGRSGDVYARLEVPGRG